MEDRLLLLLLYAVTYVEWISFYCVVLKEKITAPTKKNLIVFLVLLALRIAGIVFWGHNYLLFDIVWIAFCCCFFSVTIFQALKKWVFSLVILLVLESSIHCILNVFSFYVSKIQIVQAIQCASVVTVLVWIYYLLIGKQLDKYYFVLPKKIERLFIGLILVLMFMMSYFTFVLGEIPNLKMIKFGSILILIGGLSICGIIMAVIYYFNGTEKYRLQNEMSEKYTEQQREYFTRLLEKEQDTRRFRHDIINHLIVMQDFAQKRESEQLEVYIGDLLQDISGEQHKQYDVGSEVVNTILNYYLLPMKEKCNIKVNGYMRELESISQKDLCIIISNITKNAVEAVENIESANKEIIVDITCGEKYVDIKIENTMKEDIVTGADGFPLTSKSDKDNHGMGLFNTKNIVEKYNGKYIMKTGDGRFITEIYIKI